jgi:hypothetical protein
MIFFWDMRNHGPEKSEKQEIEKCPQCSKDFTYMNAYNRNQHTGSAQCNKLAATKRKSTTLFNFFSKKPKDGVSSPTTANVCRTLDDSAKSVVDLSDTSAQPDDDKGDSECELTGSGCPTTVDAVIELDSGGAEKSVSAAECNSSVLESVRPADESATIVEDLLQLIISKTIAQIDSGINSGEVIELDKESEENSANGVYCHGTPQTGTDNDVSGFLYNSPVITFTNFVMT